MKSIAVVLCACSPLPLARLMLLLMPGTSMVVTMDMAMLLAMPTMDTMDTHMPTTMDTTMARGLLMLSPLPLPSPPLMLMLTTDMDIPTMDTDMPTMVTTDTHMLAVDTSTDKMDIIIKFLVTKI